MSKEKIYKDMMGKDIAVGDVVLHLWLVVDDNGYPNCSKRGVKNKFATVVKMCPKSVRLRHHDLNESESNVFNTINRLIVVNNKELIVQKDFLVTEALAQHSKELKRITSISRNTQNNLDQERKKYKAMRSKFDRQHTDIQKDKSKLREENIDLRAAINLLTRGREKFRNLDL